MTLKRRLYLLIKSMNLGLNPAPYSLCPALVRALPGACSSRTGVRGNVHSSDHLCHPLSSFSCTRSKLIFRRMATQIYHIVGTEAPLVEDPDSLEVTSDFLGISAEITSGLDLAFSSFKCEDYFLEWTSWNFQFVLSV